VVLELELSRQRAGLGDIASRIRIRFSPELLDVDLELW
jgi:hypothetical protein